MKHHFTNFGENLLKKKLLVLLIFLLQVTPPKYSNMMESQGQLDNLFASGDIDRAMQMAFALLSAAGDSDGAQSVSLLNCGKLT